MQSASLSPTRTASWPLARSAPTSPVLGGVRAWARLRRAGRRGLRSLSRPARERDRRLDRREDRSPGQGARPDGTPAPAKPARRDNEYVRNGTQNLFAALQVHSGEVSGMASKTRNRFDFIAFLDRLEDEIPARQVGRGDPRQPLDQARLVAQPGRDLLLDPAAPADQARHLRLRGRPRDPDAAFVEHYNLTARPFEWTHTGKVLVV